MSESKFTNPPQRLLLTDQTIIFLREKIQNGEWTEQLPSEAALCRELQVSRVTLRRALLELTEEGLILSSGRGSRRRINSKLIKKSKAKEPGSVIRVLLPCQASEMGAIYHSLLEEITLRLASRKMRIECENRPQLFSYHQPKELEQLLQLPDTAGWILTFSTEQMQRWFQESGAPCVVVGQTYENISLPSVKPDSEATATHAAGLLVARGHRQIIALVASETSLNDKKSALTFEKCGRALGADVNIVNYSARPSAICRAVSSTLANSPAPSAFYMTCPEDAVTVLCHLSKAGISVPGQVDILVGWDDPILDKTVPPLSHYNFNSRIMGRTIGSLLIKQIENQTRSKKDHKFLSEFEPGGSLRDKSAPKKNYDSKKKK